MYVLYVCAHMHASYKCVCVCVFFRQCSVLLCWMAAIPLPTPTQSYSIHTLTKDSREWLQNNTLRTPLHLPVCVCVCGMCV